MNHDENASATDNPLTEDALADAARRILPLIDLTSLGDDDTDADVDQLCAAATTSHGTVAAVCVWPRFVARAVSNLAGSTLPVAGVANFPAGEDDPDRAVADALEIIEAGGTEVDVVYPWRKLRAERRPSGSGLVAAVRSSIPDDVVLKVILETGELEEDELIRIAAFDSISAGANFLKTSTGKTTTSATPAAVRLLCELVAGTTDSVGVKVSGGVRTVPDAEQYLHIAESALGDDWISPTHFRIGASSLLDDVLSRIA